MIILQHTHYPNDTIVHNDGAIYTNGKLNAVGSVKIVDGQVVKLDVNGDGNYDIDTTEKKDMIYA